MMMKRSNGSFWNPPIFSLVSEAKLFTESESGRRRVDTKQWGEVRNAFWRIGKGHY